MGQSHKPNCCICRDDLIFFFKSTLTNDCLSFLSEKSNLSAKWHKVSFMCYVHISWAYYVLYFIAQCYWERKEEERDKNKFQDFKSNFKILLNLIRILSSKTDFSCHLSENIFAAMKFWLHFKNDIYVIPFFWTGFFIFLMIDKIFLLSAFYLYSK